MSCCAICRHPGRMRRHAVPDRSRWLTLVTEQLEIAGYTDIKFDQVNAQVFVGKDLDDAVGFQLAIGPAGEVYREAGKLAEERHAEIAAALRAQLARYKGPTGVMMDSSSWKVTARNPG